MVTIHESIRERIPEDLRRHLQTFDREPIDFSSTERQPRDIQTEVERVGSFNTIAYIGPCEENTFVMVYFPGGPYGNNNVVISAMLNHDRNRQIRY